MGLESQYARELGGPCLSAKAIRSASAVLQDSATTRRFVPSFNSLESGPGQRCTARTHLSALLGIDRTDMASRSRQTARNLVFFDAPVGLIFTGFGE
jgi:hypothetical protein